MKNALRILAVLVALAGVSWWAAAGANTGWTKNQVQVRTVDEVTGLDHIQWQKKWVPGLDFLSITLGSAALLGGVSFLFRKKRNAQ
ncbi:MAG TPA: hypothetical protein VEH04_09925 [Verrucomicrobiae bacterium]|nr:hypothetical protein [Verrucomicrobiae bacterium]